MGYLESMGHCMNLYLIVSSPSSHTLNTTMHQRICVEEGGGCIGRGKRAEYRMGPCLNLDRPDYLQPIIIPSTPPPEDEVYGRVGWGTKRGVRGGIAWDIA